MLPTLGLWLLLAFAADAGQGASVNDLKVVLDGRRVAVGFVLDDAFDERLVERLASGLPTGFTYEVRLFKDHQRWWDKELDATEIQVAAMYNAVTREYLVNVKQDGRLIDSRVLRDVTEVERRMTRIDEIPVFTVGDVPEKWRLLVKVRASVGSRNLLSLLPTTVTTEWAESRKFRVR